MAESEERVNEECTSAQRNFVKVEEIVAAKNVKEMPR